MGYGSAEDLPFVKEMRQQLKGARLLGAILLSKEQRAQMRDIDEQLSTITATVDNFYALLGPKHWIFHNDMSIPDMAALVVRDHPTNPDDAEEALIAWYQDGDRLDFMIQRLSWHDAWRDRMPLLRRALDDYRAERYYAVVQVLLSVMDGFVNDLDPANRRGLHAYESEDIDAWNSVVGHHAGLSAAHESFRRSFKARSDEIVTELYRHGIVHGMLTNYDNPIVATKAWNRVFAVSDWARSLKELAREAAKPPPPALRELMSQLVRNSKRRAFIDQFTPQRFTPEDSGFAEHGAYLAANAFLERWQHKRWGLIPPLLGRIVGKATPQMVKAEYLPLNLDEFHVLVVEEQAAAIAHTQVELRVNGEVYRPELRWVYESDDGSLALPGFNSGSWRLVWWGSALLLKNRDSAD